MFTTRKANGPRFPMQFSLSPPQVVGNCLGSALEPLAQFRFIGEFSRKDFYGDNAVQTRVAGLVDIFHGWGRIFLVGIRVCEPTPIRIPIALEPQLLMKVSWPVRQGPPHSQRG